MNRPKIDLDRDYRPVHHYEHYRLVTLEFDIAKAWKIVAGWPRDERRRRLERIAIPRDSIAMHIIDETKALTADLGVPVLVGQFADMQPLLIDGWHRAFKALKRQRRYLDAFLLTIEETAKCRVDKYARSEVRRRRGVSARDCDWSDQP